MTALARRRMTADEFLSWAVEQPDDRRYELVAGEPIAMSPERAGHARVKNLVLRALEQGIAERPVGCEAFADGMAVRIDDLTVYEPDAIVRCGPPVPDEAIELVDPVILVEVVSPSSRSRDSGAKHNDYFRLGSVRHYLIVKTESRTVIHHFRDDQGQLRTRFVCEGTLDLTPPGIRVQVESFFPASR
jgi:Uma2 family endonuclease